MRIKFAGAVIVWVVTACYLVVLCVVCETTECTHRVHALLSLDLKIFNDSHSCLVAFIPVAVVVVDDVMVVRLLLLVFGQHVLQCSASATRKANALITFAAPLIEVFFSRLKYFRHHRRVINTLPLPSVTCEYTARRDVLETSGSSSQEVITI